MHILEMVSCGDVNGPVVHCIELCHELVRRGHRVTLLCRPGAEIGQRVAAEPSIEVIESDMQRRSRAEVLQVAAMIRERGIDVVHTHMTRSDLFGRQLRGAAHVPWVATAHNQHIQPHWMSADHVIAVSDATRRFHRTWNLVRASRIDTVLNSVNAERYANVPKQARQEFRDALSLPDSAPLLGIIGVITERKGHIYLVRALPGILKSHPEARLAIVGRPRFGRPYDIKVKDEAKRLGVDHAIHWLPFHDDIPAVMSGLDVCVIPSLQEALVLVGLEAMAAGLPIVTTSVGGTPEWAHNGKTALLVRPKNPNDLMHAICRLLSDSDMRSTLSDGARRIASERFTVTRLGAQTEAIFQRVIERSAATRQARMPRPAN